MHRLQYKASVTPEDPYTSSWSLKEVIGIRFWKITWLLLASWTPKCFKYWRIFLLRLFGASINWDVFIYSSARIYVPWLLKMESRSCLGPHSEVYNLGMVHVKKRVTISQNSYICNGTHDFSDSRLPLMIGYIEIDNDVFIGASAFILPGVFIGEGAVIGACAVVTKDVEPWTVVGGNPARFIKKREIKN